MSTFQDQLERAVENAARVLEAARTDPDIIAAGEVHGTLLDLLTQAKVQSYELGMSALAIRRALEQLRAFGASALDVRVNTPPALHREQLSKALSTALESDDTAATRLERLTRAEVGKSGQQGLHAGMQASDEVVGWQRGLERTACELCTWWERDGRVWPKDHPMPTHPGCLCVQQPVFASDYSGTVEPVGRRKR